jgi:general secretion pathway protein L
VTDAPHLQIHKTVLFESTHQIEATAATAIGIALEGLKTAKNPALNFRRGTYARENKTLKLFIERWKHPMQVAVALYVIFLVYSFMRDSMAGTLSDAGSERLAKLAKEAAVPGGGTKNLVERYIRKQNTTLASLQMLEGLDSFIPAMDILVRLSDSLPVNEKGKPNTGLDIHRLHIDNDTLTIEGAAHSNNVIRELENRLGEIAKPKTVAPTTPAPYAKKNPAFVPFGFTMKVNRK